MFDLLKVKTWRRLRYADPQKAAEILNRLTHRGAIFDLRLRCESDLLTLYIGGEVKYIKGLESMAEDFSLLLEVTSEPRPLTNQKFKAGNWVVIEKEGDARIGMRGMHIGMSEGKDESNKAGSDIALPSLMLGLHSMPDLPYPPLIADVTDWSIGQGGVLAPTGVIGDFESQVSFLTPITARAFQESRPTILIDGAGDLTSRLRNLPEIAVMLQRGQLIEISPNLAGQRGFNPLVETGSKEETLARWRWWLKGIGMFEPQLSLLTEAAYKQGARSLTEFNRLLAVDPAARAVAQKLNRLTAQPVLTTWLSGSFDITKHLQSGGHLLVSCPLTLARQNSKEKSVSQNQDGRFQALRGLLGLIADAAFTVNGIRVASVGVRWSESETRLLENLNVLCAGARWETTAVVHSRPDLATKIAAQFGEARLAEYATTLRLGAALANDRGGEWWTLKAN